jgi:[protein-PII] uridylyltransferase
MITQLEERQLQRNEDLLSLIRWRLHWMAKRREDRLVFDLQTVVSQEMGLAHVRPGQHHGRAASEALMKEYYWAAKAVSQLNQIIHLNIEDWLFQQAEAHPPQVLNERFLEKSGMLEVVDDGLYQRHPEAILETFLLYQETVGIKGLSARTLRGCEFQTRSCQSRHLHAHLEITSRHHPCHAFDESNLCIGALFVGVQTHRWTNAA